MLVEAYRRLTITWIVAIMSRMKNIYGLKICLLYIHCCIPFNLHNVESLHEQKIFSQSSTSTVVESLFAS